MTMPLLSKPLGVREADLVADRARIADFVRAQPGSTPFHLPEWSIAIERGCGQRARYLIAERGDGGIAGVLPLTEMRSALFGKALVSAGFATEGGILADAPGAIPALASGAWALAEELGIDSVELRGGPTPDGDWHEESGSYLGFVRDLGKTDEEELTIIPRNRRATVRKSLKCEYPVTVGSSPRDIAAHFRVFSESVRNLGTPVFPSKLFAEVLSEFGESADILTVWRDGKPLSSVLNLYMHGTVHPYWGGGTGEARNLLGNDAMYFELMRHARDAKGCTRYDFGRSKVDSGNATFKANWGFEPQPLSYAKRLAPGATPRVINPTDPKYRLQVAAWKKLPLWAANIAGPMISRGLG